jgi:hypothetical protein
MTSGISRVITQVAVVHEPGAASEFGELLWTAFAEVAAFYNHGRTRAKFERRWIGAGAPPVISTSDVLDRELDDDWWDSVRSSSTLLIDHQSLAKAVRQMFSRQERLIIVTDEELKPPAGWRYVISEDVTTGRHDGVASFAPLDPLYWGDADPRRLQTMKRRIRGTLMGMVGERLGFEPCDNSKCFLFADVDSVTVLDGMSTIGPEHPGAGPLTDKVFGGETAGSLGLEAIVDRPQASSEKW